MIAGQSIFYSAYKSFVFCLSIFLQWSINAAKIDEDFVSIYFSKCCQSDKKPFISRQQANSRNTLFYSIIGILNINTVLHL